MIFRDEHIYSLAFQKILQISKVIRCALVHSEKPSQVYIWDKSQRKTKEDENSPYVRLQSIYKNLTDLQD